MKGKKKLTAILATLLLTISVFMVIPFPVHAAPGAELIIPHKTDLSPKVQIGGTASIGIKVNTTDMVFNWTMSFTFNNSFLMYYTAIEGLFLKKNGTTTFNPGTAIGNQVTGLNCTHGVGNITQGTGKPDDMDQMAVTLVFVVLGYGKSDIEFIQGQCSMYSDNSGSAIALTFDDGYLQVEGKVTVEIERVYNVAPTRNIGDSVTLDLTIDTEENISSWEGGFRYDPDVLNCTDVEFGTFLVGATNTTGTIHPTNGTVWGFGQSLIGSSVKGSGTLASLVFKILDHGYTDIDLSLLDGETIEFKVKDRWGDECINLDLVDGSYELRTVVAVALPFHNMHTVGYPSIGSTLIVQLKINTLEKVSSWQAAFKFNTAVLNCTDITYGLYFNPLYSPYNATYTKDNVGGNVTGMGQTFLSPGLYASGPGVLATITFNVTGSGSYSQWLLDLIEYDADLSPKGVTLSDVRGDECKEIQLVDGLKLHGDANGDGYVNPNDVNTYMAFAYGSVIGTLGNYNANCDFDFNGYVNPTDINTYLAFTYGYPW